MRDRKRHSSRRRLAVIVFTGLASTAAAQQGRAPKPDSKQNEKTAATAPHAMQTATFALG